MYLVQKPAPGTKNTMQICTQAWLEIKQFKFRILLSVTLGQWDTMDYYRSNCNERGNPPIRNKKVANCPSEYAGVIRKLPDRGLAVTDRLGSSLF